MSDRCDGRELTFGEELRLIANAEQREKRIAELEQQLAECRKDKDHLIALIQEWRDENDRLQWNNGQWIKAGMERAAEIVLEHYPASQSIVGKELYQAICAEIDK